MNDAIAMLNLTNFGQGEGGALHQIALARKFRSGGSQVTLVVPRRPGHEAIPGDLRAITWQTPSVDRLGLPRSFDTWLQIPALVWLRLSGRANTLYIRANLFSCVAIMVARILGMFVICEHNGWAASERRSRGDTSFMVRFEVKAQTLAGKWAHRSRCVTEGIARLLVQHGVGTAKVFVVGNGVDTREMAPHRAPAPMGVEGRVQLGFIGGLVKWQGIETAVRALALLDDYPQVTLVIAGDGPERSRLEHLAWSLGLSERVQFLGYVSHSGAVDVINSFDIALAPFTAERNSEIGLSPIKIRDYAATGRVVVASNIEGIGELESAGWLFTHNADDPQDLATVLRRVMSLPAADFVERCAKARAYAVQQFDWDIIVDRIREHLPVRRGACRPSHALDNRCSDKLFPSAEQGTYASQVVRLIVVISQLDVGGAERHLSLVLPALQAAGCEVTVFTLKKGGALADVVDAAGVTVRSTSGSRAGFWGLLDAFRQLRGLVHSERPEVLHFFLPAAYLLGGLATLYLPVRCVMSRRSLSNYQRSYIGVRLLERILHRRMDAILANSRAVALELLDEGVPNARLGLIYNGVHVPAEPSLKLEARARLDIGANTLVIVCVANLIPYKGHRDLLAALASVRDRMPAGWVLLLVGRDDGIGEELQAQAEGAGLGPHVRFIGSVPDVADYLACADIGVLASHEEGFSNAILEGMAAGLPMVVTDVGGNAEAVIDGDCGRVVAARAPDALAAAVLELATSAGLRARFGERARARVQQRFSEQRCVQLYLALYSNLARGLDPAIPIEAAFDEH